MATNLTEVEKKAKELSQQDRARLALSMIESLESKDEGDVLEAWRLEVERRWADIERGSAETKPASTVFEEIRRTLR